MNHVTTTGIMLARLNYGEADKIITILTPDHGKIRVMARGVRKVKSKLAGGIELFSVSAISFLPGKKDIGTLVSTRLQTHYNHIVEDIDRTMIGYDILKWINKVTESGCDEDYYELLLKTLGHLNDLALDVQLVKTWFVAQLLKLMGHAPNAATTADNTKLQKDARYKFDYQNMGFFENKQGNFTANHIKLLRLLMQEEPTKLHVIAGLDTVLPVVSQLLSQSLAQYV